MNLLKTSPTFISLLIVLSISCSFSTRGVRHTYGYQDEDTTNKVKTVANTKQPVFKVDTSSKAFIAVKKPTAEETKKRDSLNRVYIGSIVQPYINDLKQYNNQSIEYMLGIINQHNNNLDSLSQLRIKEGRLFESNAINRYEENYLALLESNKRNDSLRVLITDLNKNITSFTSSVYQIFSYIKAFSSVMTGLMILIILIIIILQVSIFFKKKKYNLI